MAYNNYYPATYQPMYQPTYQQPTQQGIIWVQGEAGAKSYMVAPNTTVQLWDSESQKIFLKSADASGMPSIKTLEYTIVGGTGAAGAVSAVGEYVSKDELNALQSEIDGLKAEIDKLSARRRRREENENE